MRPLSPSKLNFDAETQRLFTSPEAITQRYSDDALIRDSYELGYLDQLLDGWVHLYDRSNSNDPSIRKIKRIKSSQIGKGEKKRDQPLGLRADMLPTEQAPVLVYTDAGGNITGLKKNPSYMPLDEAISLELAEVEDALAGKADRPDIFEAGIDQREFDYIKGLIKKHVLEGDYTDLGKGGTVNRKGADGKVLKINLPKDRKEEGADKFAQQWIAGRYSDSGAQLRSGESMEALHREAANSNPTPEHIANLNNLNLGKAGLNRTDKHFTGAALASARRSRLLTQQERRFIEENEVGYTVDDVTAKDNRRYNRLNNKAQEQLQEAGAKEILGDYVAALVASKLMS